MTKEEYIKILGKNIRNDTYYFCEGIRNGKTYEEMYKELDSNREKYGIKLDIYLSKPKTIEQYLSIIENKVGVVVNKEDVIDKYNEEYKKKELKKQYEVRKLEVIGRGIYGIYCGEELIYIGQSNNIHNRSIQHRLNIINHENSYLYNLINERISECDVDVCIKPLIVIEKMKVNKEITKRDLKAMELALIDLYKPIGNIEGRIKDYSF